MNTLQLSARHGLVRASLPIALAIGALAMFSTSAEAAAPTQEITITGTRTETIPYDFSVRRPVQEVFVTARVPADLDALTLNSGVALLKYNVRKAARTACMQADPSATATSDTTMDCIHRAVDNAKPQIDALVAQARSEETRNQEKG